MTVGTHGSTFGGNPLAMAVGEAVLDTVQAPGFLDGVRRMGGLLKQRLAGLVAAYDDVLIGQRGEGLMLGLLPKGSNTDFVAAARAEGLLVIAAGDNAVRLLPPLIIGEAEIAEAIDKLGRACETLRKGTKASA
jgi:acetylornithine/N-succinyldiaminopimelate aminotransferase